MVATILAALVERDYAPTSRNDVYNDRLDLLLEKWDFTRGVQRGQTPIELRKRFLEYLAFLVHKHNDRRSTFGMEEIREAFSSALGRAGRFISIETLLEDLVVRSGVLIRDRQIYSFGHLTFQEHLAGRYMSRKLSPRQISMYLGSDWWKEALLFYAAEKEDITELIDVCERGIGSSVTRARQLFEMTEYARHTQDVAVQVVIDASKNATRIADEYDDEYGNEEANAGENETDAI